MRVVNPQTGRMIEVNGPTWKRIMNEGTEKQKRELQACKKGTRRKSPVRKRSPGRPRKAGRKSPVRKRSPGRPRKDGLKSPVRKRSPGRPRKAGRKSPVRKRSPDRLRKDGRKSPVRKRSPGRPRPAGRKYGGHKKNVSFSKDGYSLSLGNVELHCDADGCTEVRRNRYGKKGRELSDDEVISLLDQIINED